MNQETTQDITIVTRNVRLHEWIAKSEGLFEERGLTAKMAVDSRLANFNASENADVLVDDYDPINIGSASEWGGIKMALSGNVNLVPQLYGIVPGGVIVPHDSPISNIEDLAGKKVGAVLYTGGYYALLRLLGNELNRKSVEFVGMGRGERLAAMQNGELDASIAFEPEISIAKQIGFRVLLRMEVCHLNYVAKKFPVEKLQPYLAALRQAEDILQSNPEKHMDLWQKNMSPETRDKFDCSKFSLGERLVFKSYESSAYQRAFDDLIRCEVLDKSQYQPLENVVTGMN